MAIEFNATMLKIALEIPEYLTPSGPEDRAQIFLCRLIGVVEACFGQQLANEVADAANLPHLIHPIEDALPGHDDLEEIANTYQEDEL